jgi:hypothetical protein
MKHKFTKLCCFLMLGFCLTEIQAQTLYVKEYNGLETQYSLSTIEKLTFSSGNINIHKTDQTLGIYSMNDIRYLSFTSHVGISDFQFLSENSELHVFPNPVLNTLNIDLSNNNGGVISIISINGKVILSQYSNGNNIETIDLTQLPKGIYMCCYISKAEMKTVKIIKQ